MTRYPGIDHDARTVRALLYRHLPSAFADPELPPRPLTMADVACRVWSGELTHRTLTGAELRFVRALAADDEANRTPADGMETALLLAGASEWLAARFQAALGALRSERG